MKKSKLASIIIVNYNGESFIESCIDSVLKTNYPNFEIVLVDNGSTDNSYQLVKRKYSKNKKVKIIRSEENLYFTGGSNLGAKHAKGKKLVFLNSDTTVENNWLTELVNFANKDDKRLVQPKILFYQSKNMIDNVGGKYNLFGYGKGIGSKEKDLGQYNKPLEVDFANGTCFLIDKSFFFRLKGFDEWYKFHYEDVDLNLRAKKQGGQSWSCPQSIIYHKGSLTFKKNIIKENLIFHIRKNRIRTVIKNFSGVEKLIRLILLLTSYIISIIINPKSIKPTLKAISANINLEIKFLIDKLRLLEIKRVCKKKNFTLLDLGCGDGSFLNICLKQNINALGVDENPPIHPKILSSSIENLNLKRRFDVVTMFHVIEHLEDPKQTLKKIKKLLNKNGVLVIETPLIGNLTEKFLKKDYFAYYDKTHLNLFTKQKLKQLIKKSGFKIIKEKTILYIFALTALTTSLKKKKMLGLIFFIPLKLLTILGLNTEIARVYCHQKAI